MNEAGGMEELLGSILSDPDMMEKLRGTAAQLGLGELPAAEAVQAEHREEAGLSPDMLARLMKLAPLLSDMSREDDSMRLLRALRPYLSEKRAHRLDEAGKMLSVVRLVEKLPAVLSENGGDEADASRGTGI